MATPDLFGRLLGRVFDAKYFIENPNIRVGMCEAIFGSDFMNQFYGHTPLIRESEGFNNCEIQPDHRTIRKIGWLDKTVGIMGNVMEPGSELYDPVGPRSMMNLAL